jgi:hypothetical protein
LAFCHPSVRTVDGDTSSIDKTAVMRLWRRRSDQEGESNPIDPADFCDDENWHGGYYEVAVNLGNRNDLESDTRLRAAREALWSVDDLQGPYVDRWSDASEQARAVLEGLDIEEPPPLYGLARLPTGDVVVCSNHVIREIENPGEDSCDWLDLSLPLGALGRVDQRVGAYPFDDQDGSIEWRRSLDDFFVDIVRTVAAAVSFRYAVIGCEVSGDRAWESFGERPPTERWATYVTPTSGGIEVTPATR